MTETSADHRGFALLGIAVLLIVLFGRLTAPSDIWDHAQPKTIAYTTDIVVHGGTHWVLPFVRDVEPASKPPLYNWLAVPAVRLLGISSEIAHRLPSVLAMLAIWLLLVRGPRWIDPTIGHAWGWVASVVFLANLSIFKLCALARPDMLLTLWVTLAWWIGVILLLRARRDRRSGVGLAFLFWTCVGLAGLTKGPPAIIPVVFAIAAAPILAGSFGALRILRPWMALWSVVLIGGWITGVAMIDADHLRQTLWGEEIYGRITGTGPLGNDDGVAGLITSLPWMPSYFMARFAPWSLIVVYVGCLALWRWHGELDPARQWVRSAALFVVVVIVVFSLSAGKRADYIAVGLPAASVIAGWWLSVACLAQARRRAVLAAAGLAMAMTLVIHEHRGAGAPTPDFGTRMTAFVHDVRTAIRDADRPVLMCRMGSNPVPALVGLSEPASFDRVHDLLDDETPCYVLSGWRVEDHHERDFASTVQRVCPDMIVDVVADSGEMVRGYGWPGRMTLYRLSPRHDAFSSPRLARSDNPHEP